MSLNKGNIDGRRSRRWHREKNAGWSGGMLTPCAVTLLWMHGESG